MYPILTITRKRRKLDYRSLFLLCISQQSSFRLYRFLWIEHQTKSRGKGEKFLKTLFVFLEIGCRSLFCNYRNKLKWTHFCEIVFYSQDWPIDKFPVGVKTRDGFQRRHGNYARAQEVLMTRRCIIPLLSVSNDASSHFLPKRHACCNMKHSYSRRENYRQIKITADKSTVCALAEKCLDVNWAVYPQIRKKHTFFQIYGDIRKRELMQILESQTDFLSREYLLRSGKNYLVFVLTPCDLFNFSTLLQIPIRRSWSWKKVSAFCLLFPELTVPERQFFGNS